MSDIEQPQYIKTDEQLAQLCQQWSTADMLALDTEFIRTDTFYPIAGLIQIADGRHNYLIDPLTVQDFSPFSALMTDPAIDKVFHSCSEDLEVFDRLFGVVPTPLLDTQVAAGLLGIGFSMGYQRLVESLLGITLEKGETRSDWLQRPLTPSQIHYAVLDVEHLHTVYTQLREQLTSRGQLDWWYEEGERMRHRYRANTTIEHYYLRVKSAWKLSAMQLSVLRELTYWREVEARKRDIPRGRVLKDSACFDIAQRLPDNVHQLAAIDDVSSKIIRTMGPDLLALITAGRNAAEFPAPLERPLAAPQKKQLRYIKVWLNSRAEQLTICPELLLSKKDIDVLVRSGAWPDGLSGWRQTLLADDVMPELLRSGDAE